MNKIRWGILSTARIAREHVIPAIQASNRGVAFALASRRKQMARAVAADLGISRAHGSYEALLGDPDVDAVYIPLPNHLHVEWSLRALEAGKHVLCEKPIGMNAEDARRLHDHARHGHLRVMEAFMYRFHPQWRRAASIVHNAKIGTLRSIHSVFAYNNTDPSNIRNQADIGGGALMDIGCYNISLSRLLFNAEPSRVFGQMELDPAFGTDRLTTGRLEFQTGLATFTCATQLDRYQCVHVLGDRGSIKIDIPFNVPRREAVRLWHQHGPEVDTITFDPVDQYRVQVDAFARSIQLDTPVPCPLDDAVANMQVIDAVRESVRTGSWVPL